MIDLQSVGQSGSSQQYDPYAAYNLRQYANLDLSEAQRTQIRSIIRSAQSDGLTQAQVEQQISSVLSPQQLATLQSSETQSTSSTSSNASSTSQSTTAANPLTDTNGPFANLNLSSAQETQINQLFQEAQSGGVSFQQFNSQLTSILSSSQQSTLASDFQTLQQQANAWNSQGDQSGSSSSASANDPFANLDLSSTQQSQIQQILQNAESQDLSPSQILSQVNSVLTGSQQSTFATDIQDVEQQSQSSNGSAQGSAPNPFTDPNGPFANLNLSSTQQSQIEQILQSAQSQGLSPDQINSQINAILSSSQQSTFATDLQNLQQQFQQSSNSQSGQGDPFSDPNGPFANLNLSSTQQSQIQQILQNAQSQGLSPSQVNSEIDGVLTSTQQSTFASDLQNLPQGAQSSSSSTTASQNVFDNLNLTTAQQSQIESILQNAQSDGLSPSDVFTQIQSVLSSSQQNTLSQNLQNLQGSGNSRRGQATIAGGLTETDIQNQIAAANSLIDQQLASELASATSSSNSSST